MGRKPFRGLFPCPNSSLEKKREKKSLSSFVLEKEMGEAALQVPKRLTKRVSSRELTLPRWRERTHPRQPGSSRLPTYVKGSRRACASGCQRMVRRFSCDNEADNTSMENTAIGMQPCLSCNLSEAIQFPHTVIMDGQEDSTPAAIE